MNEVGKSTNRVDALAKVTGKTKYPGDFICGPIGHESFVFRASTCQSSDIDTSAAEA